MEMEQPHTSSITREEHVTPITSPIGSPFESSPQSIKTQEVLCEPSSSESPPRKVRSLKKRYESCNYALVAIEPSCFEEAIQMKE